MAEQLTLNQRVEGSSPSGLTTDLNAKRPRNDGLARLRDLEQGRTRPDSALRAYLTVIAQRPDVVTACLAT